MDVETHVTPPNVADMVDDDGELDHQCIQCDPQDGSLSDGMSEVSEDDDLFNIQATATPPIETHVDLLWRRARDVSMLLREKPLLPADPCNTQQSFLDVDTGVRLPLLHCAFTNCTWTCDLNGKSDDQLLFHWGMEWHVSVIFLIHLVPSMFR